MKDKQPDERTYHRVIDILKAHIKPKCYRATDDPKHYPAIPEIDFCTAASMVIRELAPKRESGKQPIATAPKGVPVIVAGGLAMQKTGGEWFTGMEEPRYQRPLQWQPKWWMPIPTTNEIEDEISNARLYGIDGGGC